MIDLSKCHKIGLLSKAHGIKGEAIIRVNGIDLDNMIKMEWVYLILEGLPVPFFITNWFDRPPDALVVAIEDITSPEQLTPYLGSAVYMATLDIATPNGENEYQLQQYKGFKVFEETLGLLGTIDSILDIQKNPLFSISGSKGEILIPIHDDFVLQIDMASHTIILRLPEGLVDIN